jgi:long-chain acyl-CoA synthetase
MATREVDPAVSNASVETAQTYVSNRADLPEGTLVDLFFAAVAKNNPRAQLRRTGAGWEAVSHAVILANVRSIGAALRALGLQRGDRVGLLSENRPEWAWADYAMLCAGMQNVPVYPTLPAAQVAYVLKHAGARALFVSTQEQLDKALEARAELPELERIIVMDEIVSDDRGVVTLAEFMAQGDAEQWSEEDFRAEARKAQPHDVATLIYTSGTTGEPKGVMLTHNNIHSNVVACTRFVLQTDTSDIALSFLPLSHIFQRMVDYLIFHNGTTIAYVSIIDQVVAALGEVRPTIAVAVPRVYEKVYAKILSAEGVKRTLVLWARQQALAYAELKASGREPSAALKVKHTLADRLVFRKVRGVLGGRLRFFVSGGAPLPKQIALFFYGAGVTILEGYGLTETSPVTNVNTPDALRFGTVGKVIPGTEQKIADDGEILVRGPQIMKGYFRNEAATREMIDADGWLHTGDIGAIDADGFLRITDRKKDILVTAGGKNIAPQPIQNAAKLSRFVTECVLIADRRPYPILMVVPNFEVLESWAQHKQLQYGSREELVRLPQVRQKLEAEVSERMSGFARYEVPKKVLLLPREFSLDRGEITPKLSVRRRSVEDAFRSEIEALYAEASGTSDA